MFSSHPQEQIDNETISYKLPDGATIQVGGSLLPRPSPPLVQETIIGGHEGLELVACWRTNSLTPRSITPACFLIYWGEVAMFSASSTNYSFNTQCVCICPPNNQRCVVSCLQPSLFFLFWVFRYPHAQLWSLYPLSTLDAVHVRKKYQTFPLCTTSMFVFRSVGAWERGWGRPGHWLPHNTKKKLVAMANLYNSVNG